MSLPGARMLSGWGLGAAFLAGMIAFAAWAFAAPVYQAEALSAGFARFGDLKAAGVSEAALPEIAGGIAGYLKGDRPTPQLRVLRHGRVQEAFSRRELDHMPDVKRLTDWARGFWRLGLGAAGLLALLFLRAFWLKDAGFLRLAGRSLLMAVLLFVGLTGAAMVWALLDFTGMFYHLHDWLFPNDFWQLNPDRHLMIQLMPEPFFVDYALNALGRAAWLLLTFPAAWLMMRWPCRKRAA